MTLAPAEFFRLAMRDYLWAQLHHAFYASLMAETRYRLQHLDGAMKRMDDKVLQLRRQYTRARQDAITEEIEVILLSGARDERPGEIHPA